MPSSLILPRFTQVDAYGNPLVGGKLYTYANLTTTLQTTYKDAAGTITNTNPIILDSLGSAVIFLTEGVVYTFVMKDANDALLWSQDSISGAQSSSGGIAVVTVLPSSDIGPVYMIGRGIFYWNGTQYVSDFQGGFGNGPFSHRNKIINGDFRGVEMGTSFTVTSATPVPYTLTRWRANVAGTASITVTQQNAGSDFGQNCVGGFTCRITSNAAATPAAGDKNVFEQRIEGQNLLALALGTLWGGNFTIGFWVKGSIAGTYSIAFLNGGSPGWRAYVSNYTILSAGAWEFKTITVPIDASGIANWNRTNGIGMRVVFDLGGGANSEGAINTWLATETTRSTGSVRLIGTNAATLEIGNVQLEVGNVSTPFEERAIAIERTLWNPYDEVRKANTIFCQFASLQAISATSAQGYIDYGRKRAAPTITYSANADFGVTAAGGGNIGNVGISFGQSGLDTSSISVSGASGLVAGNASYLQANNTTSALIRIYSEL